METGTLSPGHQSGGDEGVGGGAGVRHKEQQPWSMGGKGAVTLVHGR